MKNVELEEKIIICYCQGHNTIITFFSFEGYQEKLVRLWGELQQSVRRINMKNTLILI